MSTQPDPLTHNAKILAHEMCKRMSAQAQEALNPLIEKTTSELLARGVPVPLNDAIAIGGGFGVYIGVRMGVEALLYLAVTGQLSRWGSEYIDPSSLEITIGPVVADSSAGGGAGAPDRGVEEPASAAVAASGADVPGVAVPPLAVPPSGAS